MSTPNAPSPDHRQDVSVDPAVRPSATYGDRAPTSERTASTEAEQPFAVREEPDCERIHPARHDASLVKSLPASRLAALRAKVGLT